MRYPDFSPTIDKISSMEESVLFHAIHNYGGNYDFKKAIGGSVNPLDYPTILACTDRDESNTYRYYPVTFAKETGEDCFTLYTEMDGIELPLHLDGAPCGSFSAITAFIYGRENAVKVTPGHLRDC